MPNLKKLRSSAAILQHQRCFYCNTRMWTKRINKFASKRNLTTKQASLYKCTAEHLQARKDGGKNTPENIVAACLFCNQMRHRVKKAYDPEQYRILVQNYVARNLWHETLLNCRKILDRL